MMVVEQAQAIPRAASRQARDDMCDGSFRGQGRVGVVVWV